MKKRISLFLMFLTLCLGTLSTAAFAAGDSYGPDEEGWGYAASEKVIDLGEIESGNVDLVADECCLSDLIRDVADTVLPDVQEKGLHLRINPMQVRHERVVGDQSRLRQVFLNILGMKLF